MTSRLTWLKLIFLRYYRDMGLRVLLYALLSLVATLISPFANTYLGYSLNAKIEFEAVVAVLTILASSMLAVSTFSLNIMVTAHRAAAASATPRVHRILLEDTTTQSVLAAFIGAFVYSLGSIVLYRLGFYEPEAAYHVMLITAGVVIIVVIQLLRWIEHLTMLGSVEDSLTSAQARARGVLSDFARHPRYGASELTPDTVLPVSTEALCAPCSGFLQLIDIASLEDALPKSSAIYLAVRPGAHVLEGQMIAQVSGTPGAETMQDLLEAFTFGHQRTNEQDAEFSLIVLSEIASKALSPGVNDPGTAIESLLAIKELLWDYTRIPCDDDAPTASRVYAAFPGVDDFVVAAFAPIARDGAGTIEVALKLRESLAALARSDDPALARAAREMAEIAIMYARDAGMTQRNLDQLLAVAFP